MDIGPSQDCPLTRAWAAGQLRGRLRSSGRRLHAPHPNPQPTCPLTSVTLTPRGCPLPAPPAAMYWWKLHWVMGYLRGGGVSGR